jgi:hypothetical protein
MAYNPHPTVVAGQTWTAAQQNTYVRDNLTALWPYTSAGDVAYATSSNTLARLPIGSAYSVLRVNSGGTAPEWGVPRLQVCSLTRSADVVVTNAEIQWDSELIDDANWHTSANNRRITVAEAGRYVPSCVVSFWLPTGAATVNYLFEIRKNGSTLFPVRHSFYQDGTAAAIVFPSIPLALNAGDYLTVYINGAANIYSAGSFFALTRIG